MSLDLIFVKNIYYYSRIKFPKYEMSVNAFQILQN